MADKTSKDTVLRLLETRQHPVTLKEISTQSAADVPERTLRRWLTGWVTQGLVLRTGSRRSTRYLYKQKTSAPTPGFLRTVPEQHKTSLLKQLRDLWTHTSTALEGNTLSLGDTHFILEEGLTVSGKPLKDHQEVIGHARAIELIYSVLNEPLTEQRIFDLHKAIQADVVVDIYKPNGAWKNETNGTYALTRDNKQVFIEYALPVDVAILMKEIISAINTVSPVKVMDAAPTYAKIHAGLVHVHPFWDGNGRIARLLANIPLLKSGLPPLVIPVEARRHYIQLLAEYEISTGQLNRHSGVWPQEDLLQEFTEFCAGHYSLTLTLLEKYERLS